MTIEVWRDNERLTVKLLGSLDEVAAEQLEKTLDGRLLSVPMFVLDVTGLTCLSSAGLRVFYRAHQIMKRQKSVMLIKGVGQETEQIFCETGFADVFDYFVD